MKLTLIREKLPLLPEGYSIPEKSIEARDNLVALAGEVKSVTTVAEQGTAVAICRSIRQHLKDVEEVRVEVKAPLLAAERKIDELAKNHVAPLKLDLTRIERIVNVFQDAEDERVAAAEAKRLADFEAAERERQKAEQAAQDAIRATQATADGPDDEEAYMTAQDAKAMAVRATEKVQATMDVPEARSVRAAGQSRKQVMRYKVTDIHALYKARPDLCKIEEKPSAILSVCTPEIKIPGLECWYEKKTLTRS